MRELEQWSESPPVKVLLSVENKKEKERRQVAECNIHVPGGDLFAQSEHQDLYAAVDDLVDKLDRQVGKHKGRVQNHQNPHKRSMAFH